MSKFFNFLKKITEEMDSSEKDYSSELQDISTKTGVGIEELQKQLKKGTDVEKEHKDLFDSIKDDIEMSPEEFYKQIAIAHIKEIPNYYDLLQEMEDSAKEEQSENKSAKDEEEPSTTEVEDEESVTEAVKKNKCPASGCVKKVKDKWRIISNKTGKLWPQKYDSETKAKTALKAYQANK